MPGQQVPPPPPPEPQPQPQPPPFAAPSAPSSAPRPSGHANPYAEGTYYAPGWGPAANSSPNAHATPITGAATGSVPDRSVPHRSLPDHSVPYHSVPYQPSQAQPGQRETHPWRWVVVGIVLLVLVVPATWFALDQSALPRLTGALTPLPTDVTETQEANVRQLVVGNCIASAEQLREGQDPVTVVPCSQEHDAQVVSSLTFTGERPEQSELREQLRAHCSQQGPENSGSARFALAPSEASWAQGDREGLCIQASN